MDQVIERARDEADPDVALQALVSERLHATLGTKPAVGEGPRQGQPARSVNMTSSRWARYAKGIGLLGAGLAIGFIWGRSPLWWPPLPATAPDAPVESAPTEPPPTLPPAPPNVAEAIGSNGNNVGNRHGDDALPAPGGGARVLDAPQPPAIRLPGPAATARALSVPARATRTSDTDSLRLALEQLRKAQLSLRESQPQRALEVLDLLDARVAASVLQEEREVTRTLALCDAGDVAAAGALARHFLERAPDSAYAVSLRESCAGKASLLDQMRERTSNPQR
jgi:hypothetical protein